MDLSIEEAYKAMIIFLEGYYERTHSDDVGGLLGGMAFLEDGTTADSAAWEDWIDAIDELKKYLLNKTNEDLVENDRFIQRLTKNPISEEENNENKK